MGLRCSLLGHDFGDPEVEREREERGSEVVLTVREIAECTRCGKPNVVSENKEVTALQDGTERDDHDERDHDERADHDEGDHDERDHDERDDAESTDEEDATPEPSTGDELDEDDAVIVDDGDADDGRAHGEWPEPDRPDEEPAEVDAPTEWPTVESDDEGFDARPSTGGSAAVDFGGGLAPERTDVEEEEGLEYVESAEPAPADAADGGVEANAGFAKADAAPSPAEPAAVDVDAEFVCPQCGFVDDVVGSSLRAGDICPDCRKGYLAERGR